MVREEVLVVKADIKLKADTASNLIVLLVGLAPGLVVLLFSRIIGG